MTFHGIPIPYTDRDDWLDKRREGIGASDVASILGLSPYGSPFTVWADKTQGAEKDVTEAMHFGKKLEEIIASEFEEKQGLYLGGRELLVRHPRLEWAMATLDSLAFESPDSDLSEAELWAAKPEPLGIVEFKTDGSFKRWDELPVQHQIQTQWQMFVSGMAAGWVACLHGGRRFEVYEIEADPLAQERMLAKVTAFREQYLLDPEAEPPDVDESPATARVIADLWSDPTDDEIELSHQTYADVLAWRAAKVRLSDAKAEVDRLKNRLAVALQDASVGSWEGTPVVSFKKQTVKEHVRKESSFRVLREVGSKEE